MSYYDIILQYDWETTRRKIYASTEADVERALSHDRPSMDDFAALVSPAADKYLNEMAAKSYRITRRRFGNTMQLYIPLYLANICQNHCVYCGFNCTNKIHRAILTPDEIHAECQAIKKDPFEHILLVTGEAPRSSSVQYMADSMEIVKQYFQQISLELAPLVCPRRLFSLFRLFSPGSICRRLQVLLRAGPDRERDEKRRGTAERYHHPAAIIPEHRGER